jgi:hypothetical protein
MEPICWLQSIKDAEYGTDISLDTLILNSRYLRALHGGPGLGADDRDNCFMSGRTLIRDRSYLVTGVFGYTEADKSEEGKTPEQIRLASINLALKYQASLMGSGSGAIPGFTDRLISEKTATQSYNLSPLDSGSASVIAGDTELYRLLRIYRRPMQGGLA